MLATWAMVLLMAACDGESVMLPSGADVGYLSTAASNGSGPPPPLSAVRPGEGLLNVGDTLRLYAYDAVGNRLDPNWSTSDRSIATVTSSGLVTAVAEGSATITAKARSITASASIDVLPVAAQPGPSGGGGTGGGDGGGSEQPAPARVEVTPTPTSLEVGKTAQLTATVKDADGHTLSGQTVTWSISSTKTATVDAQGKVTAVAAGTATITADVNGVKGTGAVTVTAPATSPAPSAGPGIWISRAELAALPMSGSNWVELKAAADANWQVQPIEQQSSQTFNVNAMAGALVYARLAPDASADAYRAKVAKAIKDLIALPVQSSSVTAPARHLGTWAITADLIDLAGYDPSLDSQFRSWLRNRLDHSYSSSPASIRLAAKQRPNNIGSWSRFSLAAASVYLGDRAELNQLAGVMKFWLGDRTALSRDPFDGVSGGWRTGSLREAHTWQENPDDMRTWRGIVAAGVTRDGNRLDGIQPEDHSRGSTGFYSASSYPGTADHRYPEESLDGALGAALVLYRAGYTDVITTADSALLRAARAIKHFADTYPSKGYHYFTDAHEASRPLINYFYPNAGLPGSRSRDQMGGRVKGFTWTFWTHGGRRVN